MLPLGACSWWTAMEQYSVGRAGGRAKEKPRRRQRGYRFSVWHKRDSAALKLFCGVFPIIQRTFEAEEELLNPATPDVRRGDPQEAHSTAAVRLPTPPIQFLGSYTVRQKQQLPARTALYPEGERLSLE